MSQWACKSSLRCAFKDCIWVLIFSNMFEDNWSCHLLLLITPLGKCFDNTIAGPIKKHKKLWLRHFPVTAVNDGITANLVIWVSKYLQCLLKTVCNKKAYSPTRVRNVKRKKKNILKLSWCIKICDWGGFWIFLNLVGYFLSTGFVWEKSKLFLNIQSFS